MSKPAIIILGAGLGGSIAAFEIKQAVGARADVTVVAQGDSFYFVPSNPWVAVGWRDRAAVAGEACAGDGQARHRLQSGRREAGRSRRQPA